jgi:signal peptidase I
VTPEFVVPPKHYFMMGDNRNNSRDSRFMNVDSDIGFIHERYIVGKAYFMFWTADFKFQDLMDRFSQMRVFKRLHTNQLLD